MLVVIVVDEAESVTAPKSSVMKKNKLQINVQMKTIYMEENSSSKFSIYKRTSEIPQDIPPWLRVGRSEWLPTRALE